MTWTPQKLRDFFASYDPKNPNHVAAVDLLQSHVSGLMNDNADWVKLFRQAPAPAPGTRERVPAEAIRLIKKYEGFRSGPYLCPAGTPTIGYGNTYYPNGQKVTMKDPPISEADASKMLNNVVEKDFVSVLEKTIPYWDEMSDNQRSALISFAYNLGAHFYGASGFNTISRVLREKKWDEVPAALLLYRNPGSAFEEGLRRRRTEEGEVWQS